MTREKFEAVGEELSLCELNNGAWIQIWQFFVDVQLIH